MTISNTCDRAFLPKRLLIPACAAALSVMLAPTAFSQPAQQSAQDEIEEILVISSTRRPELLSDINASVSILGEEELDLIAHTHIQEAANRLAGVNINRNNGQESLTSIRSPVLTGAGACGAFLLAEQGIPLRAAGFCNVNEMFDAHTESAERIEVIRGPASAFYGSNAVHGMINVVLPDPTPDTEFTVEAGPRGYMRFNTEIGFDQDEFQHAFLFDGASEEGYRDDSGYDQQKLSWVYQHTTAGGYELDGGFTLTNLNQETAGYVEGFEAYKDDDLRDTNPNPEAYRDTRSFRAWTRISRELDNDWELVLTPYARKADTNFIQHFLPGTPVEDTEHSSIGTQFAAYNSLSSDTVLAVGLDAEITEGSLLQEQDSPTVGSPFLEATIPEGRHYDYEVDATQVAPFVHLQHYWDNGFDVSLGLRYERMEYDYNNLMLAGRTREDGTPCGFGGCRYNRPADREDSFGNWSPKFGVRYQLDDQHSLQMRLKKGFRAPQATELYRLQEDQSVADLESVELDSAELALEGNGGPWEYSVTAYYMDKDNEIINNSDRINLNDSHTRHRGLELAAGWQLAEQWRFQGVYNFARHTYENFGLSGGVNIEGNDVDSAPRQFGNFQLQWRPREDLLTELEWVHMGEYYTNPENLNEYEGHDVLNLRTLWEVRPDITLALNILNLTDAKYAERADFNSFGGDRYFPGEPLRAFFSVNWRYN